MVAVGVHAVVVREVGSISDLSYPVLVRAIPIDCRSETSGEIDFGRPVPLTPDLRTVNGITSIVARTIFDVLDQRFRFSQQSQDFAHDLQVGFFLSAANVVDLAWSAAFKRN